MNFGLDYDGTVTADPDFFLMMTKLARARGHKVYIATMRYTSECVQVEGKPAPHDPIPQEFLDNIDGLHCTGQNGQRLAKKDFMLSRGIEIDVWIEDQPRAINESATQIYGLCTPEGHVITPDREKGVPNMPEIPKK